MKMRRWSWAPLCLVLTLSGGALAQESAVPDFSLPVETPETVFRLPAWTPALANRASERFAQASRFRDSIEEALEVGRLDGATWQSHVRGIVSGGKRGEELLPPEDHVSVAMAAGLTIPPVLIFYENANGRGFFGPGNFNKSVVFFNANSDRHVIENLGPALDVVRPEIGSPSHDIVPLAVTDRSAGTIFAGFAICNDNCTREELADLQLLSQEVAQIQVLTAADGMVTPEESVPEAAVAAPSARPDRMLQVEIVGAETGTPLDRVYHLTAGPSCESRQLFDQPVATSEGRAEIGVPAGAERFCLFVARSPEGLNGSVYCRNLRADWNIQIAADDIEARRFACRPPEIQVKLVLSIEGLDDSIIYESKAADDDLATTLDRLRGLGRGLTRDGQVVTRDVIELPYTDLQRYTEDPSRTAFRARGFNVESSFDADRRVWEVVMRDTLVPLRDFTLQLRLTGDTQTYLNCTPELRLSGSGAPTTIGLQADPVRDAYVVPAVDARTTFNLEPRARAEIDLGAHSACRVDGEQVVPISAEQLRAGLAEFELEETKRTMVVLISGDGARLDTLNVSSLTAGFIVSETMARLSDFVVTDDEGPYERVAVGAALGTDAGKRSSTYVATSRDEVVRLFGAEDWAPEITAQFDALFSGLRGDSDPLQFNRAFVQMLKNTLRVDSDGPLPEADILLLFLGANVGQPDESLCGLFAEDRKGRTAAAHLNGETRIFAISLGASEDVDLAEAFANDEQPGHACAMAESWRDIGVGGYVMNTSLLSFRGGRELALEAAFEAARRHFHQEPTQ